MLPQTGGWTLLKLQLQSAPHANFEGLSNSAGEQAFRGALCLQQPENEWKSLAGNCCCDHKDELSVARSQSQLHPSVRIMHQAALLDETFCACWYPVHLQWLNGWLGQVTSLWWSGFLPQPEHCTATTGHGRLDGAATLLCGRTLSLRAGANMPKVSSRPG